MNGLMLHVGAHAATLEDVERVPTPDATDTWTPVPHRDVVGLVRQELVTAGFRVTQEQHGLWSEGAKYFGLLELELLDHKGLCDYALMVGLRNSHDKSFPAGLAVGSRVFVCDNLSFSGEIVISRKHTNRIRFDLPGLVSRAVGKLNEHSRTQDERIAAYKGAALTNADACELIVRAARLRAIPQTTILDVEKEWREPRYPAFEPRTVWSLENAVTEVLKGRSALELPRRTLSLHGLLDPIAGFLPVSVQRQRAIAGDAEDVEVRDYSQN